MNKLPIKKCTCDLAIQSKRTREYLIWCGVHGPISANNTLVPIKRATQIELDKDYNVLGGVFIKKIKDDGSTVWMETGGSGYIKMDRPPTNSSVRPMKILNERLGVTNMMPDDSKSFAAWVAKKDRTLRKHDRSEDKLIPENVLMDIDMEEDGRPTKSRTSSTSTLSYRPRSPESTDNEVVVASGTINSEYTDVGDDITTGVQQFLNKGRGGRPIKSRVSNKSINVSVASVTSTITEECEPPPPLQKEDQSRKTIREAIKTAEDRDRTGHIHRLKTINKMEMDEISEDVAFETAFDPVTPVQMRQLRDLIRRKAAARGVRVDCRSFAYMIRVILAEQYQLVEMTQSWKHDDVIKEQILHLQNLSNGQYKITDPYLCSRMKEWWISLWQKVDQTSLPKSPETHMGF